ncbi:hypothetical protein QQS21_008849 [Conoideocrella luteorostrata]|uniref:SnoaL-like polyketide cyclase n=1 Tax=Conoideocrella luteorostrata TaxID=1105319 RepID=A0AAJ0CIX2_9HYPO|nr:hypothetical protein QQS21_008849 [Conoideocrella luteorostrata]
MTSKSILHRWLVAISGSRWDDAISLLHPKVSINGKELLKEEYIRQLRSTADDFTDQKAEVELSIVDGDDTQVAARVVHSARLGNHHQPTDTAGQLRQWIEHTFCWTSAGKISKMIFLDTYPEESPIVPSSPGVTKQNMPAQNDMFFKEFYKEYINTINALTMDKHFSKFCHPVVTHNDHNYSTDEYREMIESSFEDISGLFFTIKELFVDGESQLIAAVLGFTGTPVKPFRGIHPTGKDVRFSEHAFYELKEGKIARVWSVLDLGAFQRCLEG